MLFDGVKNARFSHRVDHTVLIVEDDPGMLEYLVRIVQEAGFRTETAVDGIEVVEKMRRLMPDIAILDLMLPRYGGFELLSELRRGVTGKIPLIIVTARFTRPEDRAKIVGQSNVAVFFEKPVPPEVLVNALHEILETKPPTH